ncbi:alpha/beta hydrolase family protein [Mesorhizobium sp. 1B3]|uniref:alpha/beta hydrolase family protein n=1 Tax=Mesorhizobium sp. 1B3 TaxID=3243599 RepID=UPI003D96FCCC
METNSDTSKRAIVSACRRIATLIFAAALASLPVAGANAGVGIARFEIGNNGDGQLTWTLFYPSKTGFQTTEVGPYDVAGVVGATMSAGKFPLVVISHGSGAGMLSHHDTASYLAMNGFVVAAVEHAGDNYRDASGVGKISTAYRRTREVSDVIDAVLEGSYGQRVDRDRIGVVGYSAGTVTALMLTGAEPDFSALEEYCLGIEDPIALCEGGGYRLADATTQGPAADARIGAALLFAPIGPVYQSGAIDVKVPVGIVAAASDRELPMADHAYEVLRKLSSLAVFEIIPLAGHYVFLAPCSERLKVQEEEICSDPPFVNRQQEHALLNSLAVSFFKQSFGSKQRLDAAGQ